MLLKSAKDCENAAEIIQGVSFKLLKSHKDDRGFFREIIRDTDEFFQPGFSQWSHSKMAVNTVKAWHFHHLQVDWWYMGIGVAHVALIDNREESPTFSNILEFKLGDDDKDEDVICAAVKIPQGVLHGCKVLSDFAHLFYITSKTYDPNDEGRIPFNSPDIQYSWGENEDELIVSPSDRELFIPRYKRV